MVLDASRPLLSFAILVLLWGRSVVRLNRGLSLSATPPLIGAWVRDAFCDEL